MLPITWLAAYQVSTMLSPDQGLIQLWRNLKPFAAGTWLLIRFKGRLFLGPNLLLTPLGKIMKSRLKKEYKKVES